MQKLGNVSGNNPIRLDYELHNIVYGLVDISHLPGGAEESLKVLVELGGRFPYMEEGKEAGTRTLRIRLVDVSLDIATRRWEKTQGTWDIEDIFNNI